MKRVFILAGEESGMIYARRLAAELGDCEIRGYADYGFTTADLAVMGFGAVIRRLGYFMRVARTMKRAINEWKPDVVCTIDYPGMNLRLAAYAKSKGIRTVHVVCPQVWAWKAGRIPKIERALDVLCCFFPFEPKLFRPGFAEFVGHPLAEEFGDTENTEKGLVALLPGSRMNEIERNLPVMLEAVKSVGAKRVVMPAANERAYERIRRMAGDGAEVTMGGARELLKRAEVAVVASGTATLEAALAHCPTVLVYRVSPFFAWLARRVIKGVKHIGLANIIWEKSGIGGEEPMPELLQENFTAGNVSAILNRWLDNEDEREKARSALKEVTMKLKSTGAMARIASKITASLVVLAAAFVASAAEITVGEREFPTYPYFDPDPMPAAGRMHYPYCRFDGTTSKSRPVAWQTVTLENDRIAVTMMPQIGGKIWGAVDKATGMDFIYFNDVVKFRDIAMRGPWCSGGIEFNFGVIGHAPWTASPVDWFTRRNDDGSVSCFVAGDEYITRAKWQVEVRLEDGRDSFDTYVTWFNASGLPSPYYHWMNAAYPLGKDPQFLFPGTKYSGHGGEIADWPVDPEGHHLDIYSGNAFGTAKSCHILPGDNSVYGIWWPEKGYGAVHRSESWEKFGRKIFLWALSREGGIWEDLLTDTHGQYAELQSGRYFLQPGWAAHATPFKHPLFTPNSTERFHETWGMLRDRDALGDDNAHAPAERPLEAPADFDWESAYGLYMRGEQHFAMGDDYPEAERLLKASLGKEPNFIPALDTLAALEMRRGGYERVHELCRRALAVDTTDENANYLDGYAYFAEGDNVSARDRLGLATIGARNRSAAYALIARTYLREGDSARAMRAAEKALDANALNFDALLVKAILTHDGGGLLERFPLFHALRFELGEGDFGKYIRNESPSETYIEIGSWYEESGLADKALALYRMAGDSVVARIRAAYLAKDVKALDEIAKLPIDGVAPFRRETLPALEWAAGNSDDWRFRYLLAVEYAAFALGDRADRLLDGCGEEPDSATFYLFRASRRSGGARYQDLKAAQLYGDSWRVGKALTDHFEKEGDSMRYLAVAAQYVKKYPLSNPLQIAYAKALNMNGRYEECLEFLKGVTILPSEFAGGATKIWHEAQKAVGMELTWPENLGEGRPFDR